MPAKKSSRRSPRAKRSSYDMSPMSLLQTPDEPKPTPMPGPQSMGCTSCQHLPFGAERLTMILGAIVLVLSSYALIGLAQSHPDMFSWTTAFTGALSQVASR